MTINNEKIYNILVNPVITEKSTNLSEHSKFVFNVSSEADKNSVKLAVESLFSVSVMNVNILNRKGKSKIFKGISGKRKNVKKAIVTLDKGQTIDFSVGV